MYVSKPGYLRIEGKTSRTVAYTEIANWPKESLTKLHYLVTKGEVKLYCACSCENDLELSITENGVVRVSHNRQQKQHKESCPKSKMYSKYISENNKGLFWTNDSILLNIALPTPYRKSNYNCEKEETDSSQTEIEHDETQVVENITESDADTKTITSKDKPVIHRAKIEDIVLLLSAKAWEQTVHKMARSSKDGHTAIRDYPTDRKYLDECINSVAKKIYLQAGQQTMRLSDMFYKKELFYQAQEQSRWFMSARVIKISPFKAERKFQYVTVEMPSNVSAQKAVVRIFSEDFEKLFGEIDTVAVEDNKSNVWLSGYIRRSDFTSQDGKANTWITLLRGCVTYCSNGGIHSCTKEDVQLYNYLTRERILFKVPYVAMPCYGNYKPTIEIQTAKRNIFIDIVWDDEKSKLYNKKSELAHMVCEYDIQVITQSEARDIIKLIKDRIEKVEEHMDDKVNV